MLARVCTPSSPFREREREIEREGGRERGRGERKRAGGREKEGGRDGKTEKERIVILKGMTGALAPFSYQATNSALACKERLRKLRLP
jgi:hypothetical protein